MLAYVIGVASLLIVSLFVYFDDDESQATMSISSLSSLSSLSSSSSSLESMPSFSLRWHANPRDSSSSSSSSASSSSSSTSTSTNNNSTPIVGSKATVLSNQDVQVKKSLPPLRTLNENVNNRRISLKETIIALDDVNDRVKAIISPRSSSSSSFPTPSSATFASSAAASSSTLPPSLQFSRYSPTPLTLNVPNQLVSCSNYSLINRVQFIAKGATKEAYVARLHSGVGAVLKVPRQHDVYSLNDSQIARVFWKEAVYLHLLAHDCVVKWYGGCFDALLARTGGVFNLVQGVAQIKAVKRPELNWFDRINMAASISKLIDTWNSGKNGLNGPLLYCDFMPQQFGVDFTHRRLMALDVEGMLVLKNNQRLFSNRKCSHDSECMNTGCYKDKKLWHLSPQSTYNASSSTSSSSLSTTLIDEVRCNYTSSHCIGMSIEYNVYALCEMLLRPLLIDYMPPRSIDDDLQSQLIALVDACSHPSIQKRLTIDEVMAELDRLLVLVGNQRNVDDENQVF